MNPQPLAVMTPAFSLHVNATSGGILNSSISILICSHNIRSFLLLTYIWNHLFQVCPDYLAVSSTRTVLRLVSASQSLTVSICQRNILKLIFSLAPKFLPIHKLSIRHPFISKSQEIFQEKSLADFPHAS